jgi:hypothetical protein
MVIVCKTENFGFHVRFNDDPAARDIVKHLPLEGKVHKWGDEIYFDTNIDIPADNPTMDVEVGDVAFWPEGKSICVFYGRTAASVSDKPVPASPVVVVGKTWATPQELREINVGERIKLFIVGKENGEAGDSPFAADNRKLSQAEIDELVKRLLQERRQRSAGPA